MKYSETHEWIKVDKQFGIVGITAFAQKELGEIVFAQLPIIGKKVTAGEEVAVLESTKAAVDIYSPVSGKILEVNKKLLEDPSLISKDPEGQGWLFKIHLADLSQLQLLLNFEKYAEFTKTP